MEIIWSPKARKRVREIFDYYKTRSYEVATKLIEDIDREVNLLKTFPQMAPIESSLSDLPITYRALVIREHYKVIYYLTEDAVNITTVWDCRQYSHNTKENL
jgi:plasmid stabilization system protein ParE